MEFNINDIASKRQFLYHFLKYSKKNIGMIEN